MAPEVTRESLAAMAAEYLADPAGWPAAMAARAVRLRAGHPAYSPGNQALILSQLAQRVFESLEDVDAVDDPAFLAAVLELMGDETAPRGVWRKRGFEPAGPALAIWSRPITFYVDETGARAYRADKLEGDKISSGRMFTIERTYLARDVRNESGEDGRTAFEAPELAPGVARDVFERLVGWIGSQGWTVTRSGRDSRENGSTSHGARRIIVHGGLSGWAAVETLAHEIAHALLHGAEDDRPYAGEHRGDMEAEAESVAFGVMVAMGQLELARGSARYAAEWTRDAERVAIAFERACHVTDALIAVAMGGEDVTVRESAKAAKAAAKASNRELAEQLRGAGLEPRGEAWKLAKAGVPLAEILETVPA
jgi:hypothetical protein